MQPREKIVPGFNVNFKNNTIDNSLFKIITATMYLLVCIHTYICSYVSERNDSSDPRDRREELGLFCYS